MLWETSERWRDKEDKRRVGEMRWGSERKPECLRCSVALRVESQNSEHPYRGSFGTDEESGGSHEARACHGFPSAHFLVYFDSSGWFALHLCRM